MTLAELSFDDALRIVAARAVAARTKDAGILDSLGLAPGRSERGQAAATATRARKDLGLLGADPTKVNDAVSRLRSGAISSGKAVRRLRHSTPSSFTQLVQTPQAVATALQEGDTRGALNQADVLGLKNLADPTMALAAGGGAATGLAGIGALQNRWRDVDLLTGRGESARKALDGVLSQQRGPARLPLPEAGAAQFRSSPEATELRDISGRAGGLGAAQTFFGAGKAKFDAAKAKAMTAAHPGTLATARREYGGITAGEKTPKRVAPRVGTAGRVAAVGGLATLPLMLKEWLGGGYRSGKEPAQQLAGATQTLAGRS